ncbi:hypothetical protein J4455_02615 [Candidatus Woesearchaeota archaeon]|nr:hypothetical protein [Candidatus Woesearchaeota archaeon]
MPEIVIWPAIYLGLIIGIYEIILLQKDVQVPMHRFSHAIQSFISIIIAVFASMNVDFILQTFTFLQGIQFVNNPLIFRIIIGLIVIIKIHLVSAAVSARGVGRAYGMREKFVHTFIIGILIVVAPYIWGLIKPIVSEFLPV